MSQRRATEEEQNCIPKLLLNPLGQSLPIVPCSCPGGPRHHAACVPKSWVPEPGCSLQSHPDLPAASGSKSTPKKCRFLLVPHNFRPCFSLKCGKEKNNHSFHFSTMYQLLGKTKRAEQQGARKRQGDLALAYSPRVRKVMGQHRCQKKTGVWRAISMLGENRERSQLPPV